MTVPQIVIQAATPHEPNHEYSALFESALSLQKKGDYQRAITYYTKAIELNPQIAGAYVNRGAAYESMDEIDLALQDVNTSLAIEPRAEAFNNRGNICFGRGDYEGAVQDYSKALELGSQSAGTYIYRAHSFRHLNLYDRAARDYNEALGLNPNNADVHVGMGILHSLRGDHNRAIISFDRALQVDSSDPYTYLNRGNSYYARGNDDRAEKDFGKALELDPEYAYAYCARGYVCIRRGDIHGALRDLDKALQLNADFADAQFILGSLHLERGELDTAIQELNKALLLDPQNIHAYNDRGIAYERKGDLVQAIQDYEHALSIRPNELAFVNRGIGLLRQSQWDRARSDLLSASNMGLNLVSAFRDSQGSVTAFEETHGLNLPQDIADMLSIEESPQSALTAKSLQEMFDKIRESVPPEAWDNLPTDSAKNFKHYLYGWPKK